MDAYAALVPSEIPSDTEDARAFIAANMHKKFHKWKRIHMKTIVTAYNRLLALYNTVR